MTSKFSLDDYIDVAERISNFNQKYPDGSLQTVSWDVKTIGERLFVVYQAAAYRTPEDTRPGVGIAWEPFPGGTAYTKDSELMNAETAAWGRAIVACGLTSNRKIASKQEVKARQGEPAQEPAAPQPTAKAPEKSKRPANTGQRGKILARASEHNLSSTQLANAVLVAQGQEARDWDDDDAALDWLKRAMERIPADAVDAILAEIDTVPAQLALASE